MLGNGGLIVAQRYASFRSMYRFTFVRRLVLAGPSQSVNSGERRKACKPQHTLNITGGPQVFINHL